MSITSIDSSTIVSKLRASLAIFTGIIAIFIAGIWIGIGINKVNIVIEPKTAKVIDQLDGKIISFLNPSTSRVWVEGSPRLLLKKKLSNSGRKFLTHARQNKPSQFSWLGMDVDQAHNRALVGSDRHWLKSSSTKTTMIIYPMRS